MAEDQSPVYNPPANDSQEELAAKIESTFKAYSDARFKYERQWYINDNFYDGNHFVWWRKSTGTIDRIQPPRGTVMRSIPKASRQLDSIQNLILANHPRWTVYPEPEPIPPEGTDTQTPPGATPSIDPSKSSEDKAKRSGQWLETKYDELNMDELSAELVHYGLKFPCSFFKIGFDPSEDDIYVTVRDAFDVYFAPESNFYDSPMVIDTYSKNLEEVKANPNYENTADLVPDFKYSSSDLKELRTSERFGYTRLSQKSNTITLKEAYIYEWKKNAETGKMERKIRLVTVAGGKVLRNEEFPLKKIPFVMFTPNSGAVYKPAWIERLISPNKSIDLIVSNIELFFHVMTRGRFAQHQTGTMDRILNETGQIVKWTVDKPDALPIPSLPNYVFTHISNLEKWIEEQSVSSASTGRIPRGVRAYKAIESLKSSDYSNLGVAIIKLEGALEKCAEIMLDYADNFYENPRTVFKLNEDKPDYFQVMGAGSFDNLKNDKVIPLSASSKVNVSIESGLSYTEEGKRQTLIELFNMGLVDGETVLKAFKFANVGEIISKAQANMVQNSMIDTLDFQALDPQIQQAAIQNAQQKGVNLPQVPQGQPGKVANPAAQRGRP